MSSVSATMHSHHVSLVCRYSLVIAASLPALGYLTTMDKYVLGVFGGISLVILEVAIIESLFDDEDQRESLRLWTVIADAALWLVCHIAFALVAYWTLKREEMVKRDDMQHRMLSKKVSRRESVASF